MGKGITVHPNAVVARYSNKEILVMKQKRTEDSGKFTAEHAIHLKSLTDHTGFNSGVASELSENGKIKYTHLGMCTDSLLALHLALGHYLQSLGVLDLTITTK